MAMRLCLQIGCTLDELGRRMTAQEFGLWGELWEDEPWGDLRDDLRTGIICATYANYAGKTRNDSAGPASPSEFMPFLKQEPEEVVEPDPVTFFKNL